MKKIVTKADMVCRSTAMSEFGLTKKQLAALPHKDVVNPRYRSGPKMRLYLRSDVERLAETITDEERKKRERRSEAAMKAAETRREQKREKLKKANSDLLEWASSMQFAIPEIEKNVLIRRAVAHHNERLRNQGLSAIEYETGLESIIVNYIRHELTNYDDKLRGRGWHGGTRRGEIEAYAIIRERCLQQIADAYPWLANECEIQAREGRNRAEMEILVLEHEREIERFSK
jgi:DNA-binding transcriptional MerR regulator